MDTLITLAVSGLYTLYTFILILVKKSAQKRKKLPGQEATINPYAKRDSLLLAMLVGMEIVVLFLYIIRLPLLLSSMVSMSGMLRIAGLVVGLAGVSIIGWASYTLDGEFSATIELKESHRLVTTGPYRYIRHPIYAGFILLHIGVTVALANWFIIVLYNGGLAILLIERIPREERVLQAYFGAAWEQYAHSRGRFFPKLFV